MTQPTNNDKENREKKPAKRKGGTAIILAKISAITTVLVALIGILPNILSLLVPANSPTPTTLINTVTQTDSLSTATFPAPPTTTIHPSQTSSPTLPPTATSIPILAPGKDWLQGCVSTAWKVFSNIYLDSSENECYVEPVAGVFSTQNERLKLFVDKSVFSSETAGIFVEVPSNSLIHTYVHLDEVETGELWIGIFSEPRIDSEGLLVIIPEGDVENSVFAAYNMPEDTRFYLSSKFANNSADYEVGFDVFPSNVIAIFEKHSPTSSLPVVSSKKYLFLGYQAVFGKRNRIDVEFFDLTITPR